jgi:XisH protein
MARDKFHQDVKLALESDGWKVTDDPLYLKIGEIAVQIDLGAERIIAAEKGGEKIAVEIKTFGITSFITAMYEALGKYLIYKETLLFVKSDRILYLAMPTKVHEEYSEEPIIKSIFQKYDVKIILYKPNSKEKMQWLK